MSEILNVESPYPGITVMTLNRPEVKNALSIELMKTMISAIRDLQEKPEERILIFRGEGNIFCTGLDLKEAMDLSVAEESANMIAALLREVSLSRLVTISSVESYAIAGGAGLASVCDYVLSEEGAKFGFPEVHRGLVPAIVLTLLGRQLKERDMRELFLFGELVSAERAKEMGLVNHVTGKDSLFEETMTFAKNALKGAPGAIAHMKKLIEYFYLGDLEDDLNHALSLHKVARSHHESQEGIQAFMEKRNPAWYPKDL